MTPDEFAALFPNPAYPGKGREKPGKLASEALGVTYPTWWRWTKAGAFPRERQPQVQAVAESIAAATDRAAVHVHPF